MSEEERRHTGVRVGGHGGEESTVRQRVQQRGEGGLETAGFLDERGRECVRRDVWGGGQEEDEEGVRIQLLSSSSVAVSTSQDFDDNATITAFFSKPMAQSLSILRVYSGLETGAPA